MPLPNYEGAPLADLAREAAVAVLPGEVPCEDTGGAADRICALPTAGIRVLPGLDVAGLDCVSFKVAGEAYPVAPALQRMRAF